MLKNSVRLPKFITPIRYKLQIQPDMEAFTFIGNESIELKLEKKVKAITLHSKELEIIEAWWGTGKAKIDAVKISYDTKSETATFLFPKNLSKGKGKLHLEFRGIIQESLRGFYRSHYMLDGKQMKIATTQFESTDARRAFPCFDEPSHKAVFEVSLVIPKRLTAISNTIETGTPQGLPHSPNLKVVNFAPTPKMSTYLLAYIIGEFESVQTKTKDGVTIRVFTTSGKKHLAEFSLQVAKRSLEFLNGYFKIPYPLPVLDLIAIPDFSAGAMENWGAVTFRESALLLDEQNTAFANKQQIAETIAHELVHQWFGNLVTMEWWTHLWLNESFASFMSYIVLDDLFPEWQIWTRFVMHDHANALHLDSLENTHPIEVEVHHPNQISEIFDAISYDKGASVLRMLMHYIGKDNFQNGLAFYLKKHSYKNTSSIHLWEAFEKVSGKPVKSFMSKWVAKPGYPIIKVAKGKNNKLNITQERFSVTPIKDSTVWPVPLQFELGKGEFSDLYMQSSRTKVIQLSGNQKYLKANPQETGFYRTLYSASLLAELYEPVKQKELSVIDRFGVVRDLFAMAKSGQIPTSAYLEFLTAYRNEESYIVWAEILSGMAEIYNLYAEDPAMQKQLAKYYLKLLRDVADLVGWEPQSKETQMRGLLRSAILSQYGTYGDKATIKNAQQLFAGRSKKRIIPDLRNSVYSLSAKFGDQKTFLQLKSMFEKESLQEEQRRIARAMMSFSNKKILKQGLDFTLTKSVRTQDAPILVLNALMIPHNRDVVWEWLQKNWQEFHDRYHDDHLIVWTIKGLNGFATKARSKQIATFFKAHPVPAAQRAIKQVIEQIELQDAWRRRDAKDISNCINGSLKL